MIFLVVIAGLVLILSGFYLVNSWQQYGTWVWPTFMVVVSFALTVYGVWNLPVWSGNDSNQQTSSQTTSSQAATSSSFSQPNNTGLTGQTAAQSAATAQQNVLTQLKKNYKSIGSVTFDQKTKTYEIQPSDSNTVKALNYVISTPSKASDAGWGTLTKSIKTTSKQLKKALGDGYSISMMEPDNTAKAMYTVKDGKTTYDIAN
ncbi:hypothetical protein [Paucilactobacillus wasatchensis]|uniref:DUF308 domain-containing protein n=1 Tax=Paucilactobacillus wasatchensis TaxID=1335616 RepID=A0A0D0Y4F4_9LACO|nr:hypothetical protein [Paucilactobacillus wasatchensis]KIS03148.1 hypothetical protein WDC_1268 [Paucilactobacillus wasatchensis]